MNITRHVDGDGEARLALAGDLDLSTIDRLRQQVDDELAAHRPPRRLVIDLAQVTFCDSTGIGALIYASAAASRHGAVLQVINPSGMTLKVLQTTGVLAVLTAATPP